MLPSHTSPQNTPQNLPKVPKARWQIASATAFCSILLSSTLLYASPPAWWNTRGVIDENAQEENYAVVNVGQAKWMATQAYAELSARLAPFGGVGFQLSDIIPDIPENPDALWYEQQKAVLNLGQLKAMALPFYDSLNLRLPGFLDYQAQINGIPWETGQSYPWNPDTPVEQNFGPVNIGQLKSTFAFQFDADLDGNGVPDFSSFGAPPQPPGGGTGGDENTEGGGNNFPPEDSPFPDFEENEVPDEDGSTGRERIFLDYELKTARMTARSYACLNPIRDHAIEACREEGHTGTVRYGLESSFGNSREERGPHTQAYIEATVQELANSAEWYIQRGSVWVPSAISAFYSSLNTSDRGGIRSFKSISELRLSRDAPSDAPAIGTFLQTQTQIPEGSNTIFSTTYSIVKLRIPPRAVKSPSHVFDLPLVDGESNRLDVRQLNTRILMDIDNDGEIDNRDLRLVDLATEPNTTEEQKEKANEYLFVNDDISNGLWDREDSSPDKPQGVSEDDDAQEITIRDGLRIRNGEVWFDHPAIFGLLFYETRECRNRIHMSPARPFKLEALTDKLPQKLYVRADLSRMDFAANNPQIEGDLVLKWRPEGMDENEDGLELSRIKLVVVKELGAKSYFHAARGYIEENNTKNYVADWTNQDHTYRIISMIESNTTMSTLDSFSETRGINAVVQANRAQDVIINGNQCFDVKNSLFPPYRMTRRCHGRLVSRGRILRPPI